MTDSLGESAKSQTWAVSFASCFQQVPKQDSGLSREGRGWTTTWARDEEADRSSWVKYWRNPEGRTGTEFEAWVKNMLQNKEHATG